MLRIKTNVFAPIVIRRLLTNLSCRAGMPESKNKVTTAVSWGRREGLNPFLEWYQRFLLGGRNLLGICVVIFRNLDSPSAGGLKKQKKVEKRCTPFGCFGNTPLGIREGSGSCSTTMSGNKRQDFVSILMSKGFLYTDRVIYSSKNAKILSHSLGSCTCC